MANIGDTAELGGVTGCPTGRAPDILRHSPVRKRTPSSTDLVFSSLGTVLVDEFEFLPAAPTSPEPSLQTAIIAPTPPLEPTSPISPVPAPKSGAFSRVPPSSVQLQRAASDEAPSTQSPASDPVESEVRTKSFIPLRFRARSAAASLDKTPRPSPTGSVASSRSMTPQLSFDDLDGDDHNAAAGSKSQDMGPVCESPVAMMLNDTADRRASAMAGVGLRKEEHLGGGALYALQGARMWLAPKQCKALVDRAARADPEGEAVGVGSGNRGGMISSRAMVKRRGSGDSDMTLEQENQLETLSRGSWDYLEGEGRRMVRARIRYEGDARRFQHLIKPYPRSFDSISQTAILGAAYMHVSPPYGPSDMVTLLDQIDEYNNTCSIRSRIPWRPKIVFEPSPPSCQPEQREWLEQCCGRIHILSPNHEELLCLFSREILPLSDPALPGAIEEILQHLLDLGVGSDGSGAVIVRCGRLGSVVGSRKVGIRWLPAYWRQEEEATVVDVTGAGNAYLGGVIAGLHASNDDPIEAALYGTVSASFVVEQKGLPRRTHSRKDAAIDGQQPGGVRMGQEADEWNGDSPMRRLAVLRERCGTRGLFPSRIRGCNAV